MKNLRLPGIDVTTKPDKNGTTVYSTGLAGGNPRAIAIDAAGNAYVTGWTNRNFPGLPLVNPIQSTSHSADNDNSIISVLNATGTDWLFSTYLGRNSPIFGELRAILSKTVGVFHLLRSALDPLQDRIVAAFVYGSVAYADLRRHLGEVFRRLAEQKESRIEEGHLLPDHVHMMIAIPPKHAVSQVIGFIKGKSAIHLARVYGERKRNFVRQHF